MFDAAVRRRSCPRHSLTPDAVRIDSKTKHKRNKREEESIEGVAECRSWGLMLIYGQIPGGFPRSGRYFPGRAAASDNSTSGWNIPLLERLGATNLPAIRSNMKECRL